MRDHCYAQTQALLVGAPLRQSCIYLSQRCLFSILFHFENYCPRCYLWIISITMRLSFSTPMGSYVDLCEFFEGIFRTPCLPGVGLWPTFVDLPISSSSFFPSFLSRFPWPPSSPERLASSFPSTVRCCTALLRSPATGKTVQPSFFTSRICVYILTAWPPSSFSCSYCKPLCVCARVSADSQMSNFTLLPAALLMQPFSVFLFFLLFD